MTSVGRRQQEGTGQYSTVTTITPATGYPLLSPPVTSPSSLTTTSSSTPGFYTPPEVAISRPYTVTKGPTTPSKENEGVFAELTARLEGMGSGGSDSLASSLSLSSSPHPSSSTAAKATAMASPLATSTMSPPQLPSPSAAAGGSISTRRKELPVPPAPFSAVSSYSSNSNPNINPTSASSSSSPLSRSNVDPHAMHGQQRHQREDGDADNARVSAQIASIANQIVSPVPQRRIAIPGTAPSVLSERATLQQQQQQQDDDDDNMTSGVGGQGQGGHRNKNGKGRGYHSDVHSSISNSRPLEERSSYIGASSQHTGGVNTATMMTSTSAGHPGEGHEQQRQRQQQFQHQQQGHVSQQQQEQHDPAAIHPPKPKLRNLDTHTTNTRNKVSSFFGGISDSIANGITGNSSPRTAGSNSGAGYKATRSGGASASDADDDHASSSSSSSAAPLSYGQRQITQQSSNKGKKSDNGIGNSPLSAPAAGGDYDYGHGHGGGALKVAAIATGPQARTPSHSSSSSSSGVGVRGSNQQYQDQDQQKQQQQRQQRPHSSALMGYGRPPSQQHQHQQQQHHHPSHSVSYSSSQYPQQHQQQQYQQQAQPSSSYPSSSSTLASIPQSRSQSQPLQPRYPSQQQQQQQQQQQNQYPVQHSANPSTSSTATAGSGYASAMSHHQYQPSLTSQTPQQRPGFPGAGNGGGYNNNGSRNSFYGLDAHLGPDNGATIEDQGQMQAQNRWRAERRASPSTSGSSSRPTSQSVPRSESAHYHQHHVSSPSISGVSIYAGGGEAYTRRRVASWATRSNTSSVYGLNMTSPQLGPGSISDLPPVPPVPHLTQAHLRPGQGVSLLSHQKTLDMYRANVKKTNDPEITFELATFMLGIAREMANQEIMLAMQQNNNNNFGGAIISEENLLSSLHDHSSSPSPDPSFSFHSRSSGSSGDLAVVAGATSSVAAARGPSSQGGASGGSGSVVGGIGASGMVKRGSHSPSPSISTTRLGGIGTGRTGSPTNATAIGTANVTDRKALVAEALSLLKRSADRGHIDSQYLLADMYANGSLEGSGSGSRTSRASIYAQAKDLIPGVSSSNSTANGLAAGATIGGSGGSSLSPLDKMQPSPTGSAASLGPSSAIPPSSSAATGSNVVKPDFDKALPLFIAAAKHGHAPSCYRAGQCFENGWGCRKDSTKAVQFYRKSAASSFPEAMYRLGMAELNGELGLTNRQKEGFKWLKQVAAMAESINDTSSNANGGGQQDGSGNGSAGGGPFSTSPGNGLSLDELEGNTNSLANRLCTVQALHELALLHERGIDNVVFVDNEYAAELLARASELGYAPSAYKLGECYEYGKMGCPQDAALSIHYYNIAAQQNHKEACFALTAWYLVGSPGILPQSDTEAYLWAKKAAEQGLAKAEYAVGYFTEVGIGALRDDREAISWFRKAAEHGDKRAITRLRTLGVNVDALIAASGGGGDSGSATSSNSPPTSPRSAKNGGFGGRKAKSSTASRDQLRIDTSGTNGGDAAPPSAGKRRSRRNTLPNLMGMASAASPRTSSSDRPAMPSGHPGGKKTDGDCIVS